MGNEEKDKYIAIINVEERTQDSRPSSYQTPIFFTASKNEDPESKLEELLNQKYLSAQNHRITEYNKGPFIYKIGEEIKTRNSIFETSLKKMYENSEDVE
jgi:hypothetical protein